MFDLDSNSVVLAKVIRRKVFVLGDSRILARKYAALLDNGDVRVVSEHREGRVVSERLFATDFDTAVERIRYFESRYTTAELPEWRRI
ncbi:hypothetical protein GCM10010394_05160 [Streptomyces crystallinus]|uniref:Uncharacterized protein n=1 Tax=Streptomyces crystallinus TaxID=68191 RepID=A0ABN1F1V1_9ACTN